MKSSWKWFEIYHFSRSATQHFVHKRTMVANIFEEFELPPKKFLATPLLPFWKKKNIWKMKAFRTKPTDQNKSHYHNFIFSKNSKILVLTVTCICQKWTDIWDLSEFWNVTFIVFEKKQISTKELKSLTTYLLVLHRRFFKKNMYNLKPCKYLLL